MIKKQTLFKIIIPTIMIIFFVRNLVLVETENMDSWMGGGMRMFAKIDKMIYRVAGVQISHHNKTYFVNFRNIPELEDEDVAARILPSNERSLEILNKVKKMSWVYYTDSDSISLKKANDTTNQIINSNNILKIVVYATSFDNSTNKVNLKPLNEQ
jgi:hypothetical protein